MQRNNGFTLIELMIVVVIIGILAAIAVPNFIALQDRAREAAVKSNGHTAQLAVEDLAVQNNGVYPSGPDAEKQIEALMPDGEPFKNPFVGNDGFVVYRPTRLALPQGNSSSAPTMEGMVVYTPPDSTGVYMIDCYGKDGVLVLTLSNG